jgi:hypothetical protein
MAHVCLKHPGGLHTTGLLGLPDHTAVCHTVALAPMPAAVLQQQLGLVGTPVLPRHPVPPTPQ